MDKPASHLQVDPIDPPDLTDTLQQSSKRLAGTGSFGTVYRCLCARNGEVAVKAISFPRSFNETEKNEFLRKMRRELGIWRRLDHPNIVRLLGTARGEDFGSDYPCMVSMWMPHGTLADYVREHGNVFSRRSRVRLITGSAAGLAHLHSKFIMHGDFHPGNILIDTNHNPRLTDFSLSQTLDPQDNLTYLWTHSVRPGTVMWAAPELLYPELFLDHPSGPKVEPELYGDIYSFGSTILFILSGRVPWTRVELESRLQKLHLPPRPQWPIIPNSIWDFIEQCWSPQVPRDRPSAQEVLSFCENKLERLLQPDPTSEINVVLFGPLGCGKSSIVNILAEKQIASVSTNVQPCTKQPQPYDIPVGGRRFRVWDTTGFHLPQGASLSPSVPYEQAYAVLQSLPVGIHLILLCARKDEISSLGSLYWFINNILFNGHAPIALVITHFDTPDQRWWERNERFIAAKTGIPVQSIPRACTTTVDTGCDHSREMLKSLLETNAIIPTPLSLKTLSHRTTVSEIAIRFRLSDREAMALVKKLRRPRHANQGAFELSASARLLGRWLRVGIKSGDEDLAGHRSNRLATGSCQITDRQSRSSSPLGVTTTNERLSTMFVYHRAQRRLTPSVAFPNHHRSTDTSHSGRTSSDPKELNFVQQVNDEGQSSQPNHLMRESGKITFSVTFPAWLTCSRSSTEDDGH